MRESSFGKEDRNYFWRMSNYNYFQITQVSYVFKIISSSTGLEIIKTEIEERRAGYKLEIASDMKYYQFEITGPSYSLPLDLFLH